MFLAALLDSLVDDVENLYVSFEIYALNRLLKVT
jgi:hypothetical protein